MKVPLRPGGGARAVGDDVHCFECEEALLHQMHREGHITFCGGGVTGVGGVGGHGKRDEMCGCAAPAGREHDCASSSETAEAEAEAFFDITDADRDRMRRIFERAERDKRKERERNIKREGKSATASQETGSGSVV